MKNKPISICNEIIHPGEQASLALPLPELFSCAPMYMPIKVVHGKQSGPCLLVIATIHGNELNGAEIINRLLQSSFIKRLKGTLIAVPIVNVYGFINKSRTMPSGAILNQSFPGSIQGNQASRLAHIFCENIFSLADYCIDLQTGLLNHSNLPEVFVSKGNEEEFNLAQQFGAPVIAEIMANKGSLRAYANAKSIPYMVYEAGEAMRFDDQSIKIGVRGIVNIMRHLNMLPPASTSKQKPKAFIIKDARWVRSPTSGITHTSIKLGQKVTRGEVIATIKDPFGTGSNQIVKAPFEGVVVSFNNLPLVHEGLPLCQIASFEKLAQAITHFEDWGDNQELENS